MYVQGTEGIASFARSWQWSRFASFVADVIGPARRYEQSETAGTHELAVKRQVCNQDVQLL